VACSKIYNLEGGFLRTMGASLVLLFATSLLLGFRHGIDWDHIAAITDIVSGQSRPWRAVQYGSMYALGHSMIIFTFGLVAIVLGLSLPPWIDTIMEHVVGFTLLLLGIWVLGTVIHEGRTFRLRSRWMLLIEAIKHGLAWFRRIVHQYHVTHEYTPYGRRSCFTLGLLHGAGAETPTQVLLFATAAGVGGTGTGSLVLLLFVLGLFICNSLMSLLVSLGFRSARHHVIFSVSLGVITGVFSSVVGVFFLLGHSALLPAILGG
jgi:high-affinity nickel permease